MAEVISVRFKNQGKIYYFSPNSFKLKKDDHVIVETARGVEYGYVIRENFTISGDELVQPLKPVLRLASDADKKQLEENKLREEKAFEIAAEKIKKHNLKMNLLEVEYTFDRSKILFYFYAENRIDFRELVKDLAAVFRTRIELRQIGVRDEARILKSFGTCGRQCCCSTFLSDFKPVTIKMAKDQNLSLNPSKISGACGRLMCCLNYEQNSYEYLWKDTPTRGSLVKLPNGGKGTVIDVNVLTGTVKVVNSDTDAVASFNKKELKIIKKAHIAEEITPEIKELADENN